MHPATPDRQALAHARSQKMYRLVCREFLAEPNLYRDVGLDRLPEQLADLLNVPYDSALRGLLDDPLLTALGR